jgi:prevent-host-death family protein
MTIMISVGQARISLPRLLARVKTGEEIVIAQAGKPVARLLPVADKPTRRVPGTATGNVIIAPDFNAPLPEEILQAFEQ